jgi:hypothetical protein
MIFRKINIPFHDKGRIQREDIESYKNYQNTFFQERRKTES